MSATEALELTQERANGGNRRKAIRDGIATLTVGELNSAGGSVFRALQQQHRNLPIRLTSMEGAGRVTERPKVNSIDGRMQCL